MINVSCVSCIFLCFLCYMLRVNKSISLPRKLQALTSDSISFLSILGNADKDDTSIHRVPYIYGGIFPNK